MQADQKTIEFIEQNSLDGGFLQSAGWIKFQEKVGRKTHALKGQDFLANIIEHQLPIVGKYFYIPRGPIFSRTNDIGYRQEKQGSGIKKNLQELIELAKKTNVGWVRIEPKDADLLNLIKENCQEKIVKSPHDMQPKEIFVVDISKDEEQLLSEMKAKTRYNIKIAQKHKVSVQSASGKHVDDFLRLTREMAERQGISTHPGEYYRKMIESFPDEMLKLYIAQYDGKIIAANLILFFGRFATYLHGASSNESRNVMAPFLLQWQAILDAKNQGCEKYDFGGVHTKYNIQNTKYNSWEGITNFKMGFSPKTKPIVFPGTYDIIINPRRYNVYRGLQKAKALMNKIRR